MTKLTGAALDRALANALGVKSVHDCEKWVGLTEEERKAIANATIRIHGQEWAYATAIEAKLKDKNT